MLMLLFRIGDSRYALDTKSVVEVIPKVELTKIHGTSSIIAGLFNYQGHIVPVINLSQILGDISQQATLSTRIILINQNQNGGSPQLLGLLAEQVTETLDSTQVTYTAENTLLHKSSYLDGILLQQQEMIQYLKVDHLLSRQEYTRELSKIGISQMGEKESFG
ncbi:MAG: chemotaxis protein CheW [Cyanobacteria bacterium P01_F01_bin.86]